MTKRLELEQIIKNNIDKNSNYIRMLYVYEDGKFNDGYLFRGETAEELEIISVYENRMEVQKGSVITSMYCSQTVELRQKNKNEGIIDIYADDKYIGTTNISKIIENVL